MSIDAPGITAPTPETGFRAAAAFYPACGLKDKFQEEGYRPYSPVHLFHGLVDEETSPKRCEALVNRSKSLGGIIQISLYPGASHGFDDPSTKKQSVEANATATEQAVPLALSFFARYLKSPRPSGQFQRH